MNEIIEKILYGIMFALGMSGIMFVLVSPDIIDFDYDAKSGNFCNENYPGNASSITGKELKTKAVFSEMEKGYE